MTTENQGQEQEQVQDQVEDPDITGEVSTEEVIDWSLKGPEMIIQIQQLEHQLSSEKGISRSRQTQDERLNRMEDHLSGLTRTNAQYMDYVSRDDPEWARTLEDNRNEVSKTQQASAFETRHNRIASELVDIVREGESLVISEGQAEELERLWNAATTEAQKTGDTSHLVEVKIQAERMKNEAERRRATADIRKAKEDAKKTVQREKEKAGIYDQDTGPIIGGARDEVHGTSAIERGLRTNSPLARRMRGDNANSS